MQLVAGGGGLCNDHAHITWLVTTQGILIPGSMLGSTLTLTNGCKANWTQAVQLRASSCTNQWLQSQLSCSERAYLTNGRSTNEVPIAQFKASYWMLANRSDYSQQRRMSLNQWQWQWHNMPESLNQELLHWPQWCTYHAIYDVSCNVYHHYDATCEYIVVSNCLHDWVTYIITDHRNGDSDLNPS